MQIACIHVYKPVSILMKHVFYHPSIIYDYLNSHLKVIGLCLCKFCSKPAAFCLNFFFSCIVLLLCINIIGSRKWAYKLWFPYPFQTTNYGVDGHSRAVSASVKKIRGGQIKAGKVCKWENKGILIPPLAPSRLDGCNFINISYELTVRQITYYNLQLLIDLYEIIYIHGHMWLYHIFLLFSSVLIIIVCSMYYW